MPPPDCHGYVWTLAADDSSAWSPLLERFPTLGSVAGARELKSNHFRSVYHLPREALALPEAVIVKAYRYTSRWDRWRYRILPHRARQEWTALKRFGELGLPTARALGVAELRERGALVGGGLIASYLEGTRPLAETASVLFDDPRRTEDGFRLVQDAGRLVRRMHDAGIWHRDLHAGNVLVGSAGELYLIDLHTCFFLRRLWRWQRLGGLAKLCHSLRKGVPAEALSRLASAYGLEALGDDPRDVTTALGREVDRIQRVRVRSRSKRCFLPSTQFAVARLPGAVVYHLRRQPLASLEPLWTSEPAGTPIKRSERGWVAQGALGGVPVCVKHRRYGWVESVQAVFESHSLRRAYGGGQALAVRGIATPEIIALRETRRFGLVREAHLVTAFVPDAAPLDVHLFDTYWRRHATPEAARAKHFLAEAVGRLARALHDSGLFPHDLSPQNVLVRPALLAPAGERSEPAVLVADLDHLYLWKPLSEHGRRKNLAQLGNLPEGHISTTDLWRGLRAYARGEPRFLSQPFVEGLRRRLLAEHWRVLSGLDRGESAAVEADAP